MNTFDWYWTSRFQRERQTQSRSKCWMSSHEAITALYKQARGLIVNCLKHDNSNNFQSRSYHRKEELTFYQLHEVLDQLIDLSMRSNDVDGVSYSLTL